MVLTSFFRGVPRELEDAARIDGASSVQVLWHIILPLAAPGIAAVVVFQSVFVWNDYFTALIVIQKPALLAFYERNFQKQGGFPVFEMKVK